MIWTTSARHRYRGIAAAVRTNIAGAPPALVAVATDIAHHDRFMQSFQIALWSVVGLAALLTGFLGWIAAHRGLAPLKDIRKSVAAITANRLDRRLSTTSIPSELAEVVETLNDMLARLQESFRRLSDFSSDIAHELRTPVSNLMTQTQVTLSNPRTADEYRDVLASNGEEFERLSRMIGDMLFLAKADNSLVVPNRESIDLRQEEQGMFQAPRRPGCREDHPNDLHRKRPRLGRQADAAPGDPQSAVRTPSAIRRPAGMLTSYSPKPMMRR